MVSDYNKNKNIAKVSPTSHHQGINHIKFASAIRIATFIPFVVPINLPVLAPNLWIVIDVCYIL